MTNGPRSEDERAGAAWAPAADELVLGIDTSTVVCAGLARGGEVVASAMVDDSRAHVEQLMPLVTRLLRDEGLAVHDLGAVAVGVGPGPFTGLRVGVVAACVLAEALQVPVRGVCSLDALAVQAVTAGLVDTDFVVASDARRRELYWARYDRTGARVGEPQVSAPGELPALPTCGPGATVHVIPGTTVDGAHMLDAGVLAASAWTLPDVGLEPLYLRRPDAEAPKARKSSLPVTRLAMGANR